MKKMTFDTNMFLNNLEDIKTFSIGKNVVVLLPVIAELDNIKNNSKDTELKYKGRKASRFIKEKIDKKEFEIFQCNEVDYECKPLTKYELIDDMILSVCKENEISLVTRDYNVYFKAIALGIECCIVENENKVENPSMIYKGVREIYVSSEIIDFVHNRGYVNVEQLQQDTDLFENESVTLINYYNPKQTALTIHKNGVLKKLKGEDKTYWGAKALNTEQKYALNLLSDDDIRIVSMTGDAGSSKTFLSLAVGLELKVNNFGKGRLYLTRPPVPLSRNLSQGFKPGTILEKAIGTLGCYSTNLEKLCEIKGEGRKKIDGSKLLLDMMEQCEVSYLNIEDILGTSFSDDDFIIVDEAELLTKDEMKAILTRGGKIVVIGDVKQGGSNKVDYEDSGLLHLIEVGKNSPLIGHITLQNICRSEIVREINEIW